MKAILENGAPTVVHAVSESLDVHFRKGFVNSGFELDVSFVLPTGITILFGASGAGKTTLLDCIAGLRNPDSGRISIGERVFFQGRNKLATQHRGIGYVFQDLALFPHLSAEKNIQYGLAGLNADERNRRCKAVLESFRIAHLRSRKPGEISGGERQRIALARALV